MLGVSATFTEPHQYQEWIRPARTQIVPTARGAFRAALSNLTLHHLTVQQGTQSLPTAVRTELHPSRCTLMFHAAPTGAAFMADGFGLSPDTFVLAAPAEEHFLRIPAECRWATLTLTPETYGTARAALTGGDFDPGIRTSIIRPAPDAAARLRAYHHSITQMIRSGLDAGAHPEAARAADQALLAALIDCLADQPDIVVPDLGSHKRTSVLRGFYALLEESDGLPLYIPEVCTRLGVAVRTLHTACMEHTGLSPHRFLSLRRMQLARQALVQADPKTATVTGIAADLGFWEFGRFSVRYKWLFGESPSVTLTRRHI